MTGCREKEVVLLIAAVVLPAAQYVSLRLLQTYSYMKER
jgi:hypothetical protein